MTGAYPLVVVQEIVTRWGKAGRSGALAALRNTVPEALALPYVPAPVAGPALLHHRVEFGEDTAFREPVQRLEVTPLADRRRPGRFGCVRLYFRAEGVKVVFAWTVSCGGAPERTPHPRPILLLTPGTGWGRIRWNGRFGTGLTGRGWEYRHTTVNVGLVDRLDPTPFAGEPASVFSSREDLR